MSSAKKLILFSFKDNIIDAIENKSFAADMEAQDEMFGEFKI